jgi:hypothetical protein
MSARIEGALWVQPLANYEVWRLRLADAIAPADNVVCLGGTEVPSRYRERMVYGSSNRCKLFRIWPPGHVLPTPDPGTQSGAMSTMVFDVVQDEKVEGVGLIKDQRNLSEIRARWKSHPTLAQTTLEALGLPGNKVNREALVVCSWGAAIADQQLFADSLAHTCSQPVFLLRGPDPNGTPPPPATGQTVSSFGEISPVHCVNLPALSWSQQDEVIWSCDLLFCGQRDVAHRAMEAGTPMLWTPPPGPQQRDDDLADWYFEGLDPGFKRSLVATAYSLRDKNSLLQNLAWYLKQRLDLEQIARQVAGRITQARHLADTLPSLSPTMMEQVRMKQQQRDNAHPPTWPMSLPGQVE